MPTDKGYRNRRRSNRWWTRERVILGLKRFYDDFGFCPTSSEKYAPHQQFTGRDPLGRRSHLGWHQRYPSFATVLLHFKSFREAWRAAGFDVDRGFEEWSPAEDWFILESVGVLHRDEVAELIGRTGPAIKRRLYDLGDIRSYNRWGITLARAAELMDLSYSLVKKYLDYGIIPYFKGVKLFYLNPADLLKIEEFDWSSKVDPELEQLIRAAVAQRICKMILFRDKWREHEVYKFQKTKERFSGRIKNPRKSVFMKDYPAPPNGLDVGDWVKTTGPVRSMQTEVGKRFGVVKNIYFSWQRVKRYDGTKRSAWVAMVDFPKIRTITGEKDRRVHYTIPLDYLEHVDPPQPEAKPLKMNPAAIRSRERFQNGLRRARTRMEEIRHEIS